MLPQFFLTTKLLPPRLGRRVLPRSRLIEKLRSFLDQPATIVCAEAGCGKTTLVTDFVRSSGHPFVWFQIDRSDLDLAVFFGYLVYGIRTLQPGFGDVILRLISTSENLSSKTDQLIDAFASEISEQIDKKFIVVLDDYHHIVSSDPIAASIDRLIQYAPDVLHVVITTRSMPNLSVTRLRSKGMIGMLGRHDLSFTKEEVDQLFEQNARKKLDASLINQFYHRTNGWATGLQVIVQAIEHLAENNHQPGEAAFLEILKRSDEEIFDYFAEEVFQYEPPETQEALLKLSVFTRIDHAAASCVLPFERAYQLLVSLQRNNVFISQIESGEVDEFAFHPMFRRFLRRRLKAKYGEAGMRSLENQYADHFMKIGKWQKAGLMYAEARNIGAIARILVERGGELLEAGLFEIVKRGYATVRESASKVHPEISRIRAHIARTEGDLELAEHLFNEAITVARATGESSCEALALHGLASVSIQRGEHAQAFSLATQALAKAPVEDIALRAVCEHTIGNCEFLASITTGAFHKAINTWQHAAKLARQAGKENLVHTISHNIGMPYAFTGDFARAREWFSRLIDGEAGRVPLPQHAVAYSNLARADFVVGDVDSCERRIEKAFEVCRLFSLTLERAEAHEIAGTIHRERCMYTLAREHYLKAEALYRNAGIQVESRELPDEQVRLLLAERKLSKARDAARLLLEKRTRLGHAFPLARARLLLGQVLLEEGNVEAKGLIQQALDQFKTCGANAWIATALLLLARAELTLEQAAAVKHLTEGLQIARELSLAHIVNTEARQSPEIFQLALGKDIESDYLESLGITGQLREIKGSNQKSTSASTRGKSADVTQIEVIVNSAQSQSASIAAGREIDLVINMLGPVEVFREQGRCLAPDAWTLSRALRILCFIASRQNHRATKDAIIETYWPDTRPEDIDKNFWPTISYIRRALNSNQEVKKNFIRYRESAYHLNPEFNYLLDIEEFERLISSAQSQLRDGDFDGYIAAARQAVELYRGEFLEEIYDTWVEEPRAYYQTMYLTTLKDLADHYHRSQHYEQSIAYYKNILSRDPYREDVHRQLMDSQMRIGNRVAVREQYENLRTLLREELGVDPLPETVATYNKLLSGS